ncbi:compass histone methyltransferase subunit [Suhomyces tanzawaensis NRRL Y-17324]|uniref:Compass histone methyltransferase subunit n=1 Tax=Suhomyces tanzawaensis NRRL Y-17324 TaxID=984487 RepID=A0A1E4SB83_9ASCO|nr:compass histone methyltransferase subunit [Suhomyces tanzawaensis NRRL Y-17324]ODV76763.1 compass histone methyltransferase subunit [Suhomyces tanzawaensis NRRL Y-17324]
MNLALQDPFAVAKEYPETLVNSLTVGHSVVIQFNYKGDYLASGLSDGVIVIYDMISGGAVAQLNDGGHTRPVTSLSWSRCGRYILSSSQDWSCILWDLSLVNNEDEVSPVISKTTFDGPIWQATMHPKNHEIFSASLFEDEPVLVSGGVVKRLPTGSVSSTTQDDDDEPRKKRKERHNTLVTAFSVDGNFLFTGTSKGWLNVIAVDRVELVHSEKMANANVKNLVVSANGRKLAINTSDRIIRQVNLPDMMNLNSSQWEFEIEHKYQDVVNKLQWNSVSFNYNAEFLVASTYGQSSHDLYVWETSMGSLVKILEGSNEELVDVKWNHARCTIGATGIDSGAIYLWLIEFPQKWSALAPDFVEIEENIEYEEKEDEFDIIGEDALNKKRLEEEHTTVDVVTRESLDARGFDTSPSFVIPINYER